MSHLTVLPVLIPLITGAILLVIGRLGTRAQGALALLATASLLPVALSLLAKTADGTMPIYYVGDWPAPYGIALVADRLSALMLTLGAVLGVASLVYALSGEDRRGSFFHALFQMQLLGINGAFLTGDLFNLFVFFEILLIASYTLQLHGGGRSRVRAALHLVVLNLIGSSIFLIGIGAIYAATGTLNMADLAVRVAGATPDNAGLLRAGALLLLGVFALKAALVPLGFWLAPAYAAASAPVAALFAILTKVGVYAILRVHGLIFGPEAGAVSSVAVPWLAPVGLATIVIGTLGVLASRDLRRLLAHLVVVSAGTLTVALGLDSQEAVSAALYYALNSTLVGGGLFLLADLISRERGDDGTSLEASRPVARPALLGSLFFLGAIGVAGLPPFAGFVAKIYILQSALGHPAGTWVFAVILASGLLVLVSLSRAGSALFWRTGGAPAGEKAGNRYTAAAAMALLLGTALLTVGAAPTTRFTEAAAAQLADRAGYIQAVMANEGVSVPASQRGQP
jgi:multicomponent K+:H+ antiporter subunit D